MSAPAFRRVVIGGHPFSGKTTAARALEGVADVDQIYNRHPDPEYLRSLRHRGAWDEFDDAVRPLLLEWHEAAPMWFVLLGHGPKVADIIGGTYAAQVIVSELEMHRRTSEWVERSIAEGLPPHKIASRLLAAGTCRHQMSVHSDRSRSFGTFAAAIRALAYTQTVYSSQTPASFNPSFGL